MYSISRFSTEPKHDANICIVKIMPKSQRYRRRKIEAVLKRTSRSIRVQNLLALLGVEAADRLINLGGDDGGGDTVLVTTGVVDTSADPKGVGTVLLRAGTEVFAIVLEHAVLGDSPLGLLTAGAERLSASSVSEVALAHTASVSVDLLSRVRARVEEELAGLLVEDEGGVVLLGTAVAAGALVLHLNGKAVHRGLDIGVVNRAGRAKNSALEGNNIGVGGGRGEASEDDEVLELHIGGCGWGFN